MPFPPARRAVRAAGLSSLAFASLLFLRLRSARPPPPRHRAAATTRHPSVRFSPTMKRAASVISIGSGGSPPATSPPDAADAASDAASAASDAAPERVRVISWNIDMDTEPRDIRARALAASVLDAGADVVLLQEVTGLAESGPSIRTVLERALCGGNSPVFDMHLQAGWNEQLYFVAALTRRGLFRTGSVTVAREDFAGSRMARGLVTVEGRLERSGAHVAFSTSHLESLPMGSEQRVVQLGRVIEKMRDAAGRGVAAVFAGDTNLREREVPLDDIAKTKAAETQRARAAADPDAPPPVLARGRKRPRAMDPHRPLLGDAWVMAGSADAAKYTWDTSKNDNLDIKTPFKPKARYDRFFLLGPRGKFPDVASMRLVGTERLESCGVFISDHFGVLVDVDFTP